MIGLDFRGHGKIDKPHDFASFGTARLASDVIAVLDHLGIPRAALVATGDGLIGHSPNIFAHASPALALVIGRTEYPSDPPKHLAADGTSSPQPRGDEQSLLVLSRWDYPFMSQEEAGAISVPMRVVCGQDDMALDRGQRLAASLGCGHHLEIGGDNRFSLAADSETKATVATFLKYRGDAWKSMDADVFGAA